MPHSSQALYFHLGLHADDDGVVEAYTVVQTVGAAEDDLRILCAKGFIQVLNEDLVAYITDWRENNKLRADRKIDSIYKDLLLRIIPDANPLQATNRADRLPRLQPGGWDAPGTSQGQPQDATGTAQDRLGEVSLVEESIGECMEPPQAPPPPPEPPKVDTSRHKYGQYGWVKLTDAEYTRLVNDFGKEETDRCIAYVDESAQSTGNKNKWKDWNLVVRKCKRDGWGQPRNRQSGQRSQQQGGNIFLDMANERRGGL